MSLLVSIEISGFSGALDFTLLRSFSTMYNVQKYQTCAILPFFLLCEPSHGISNNVVF